nr:glutaredoxin 2 [Snodgrassella alvi]
MQLYIYDHCPYCVRAEMIFGFKKIPVTLKYLLNDDEETPNQLIGQKMVPILVKDDHTAMGESLDIVHYIDQLSGTTPLNQTIRPQIQRWLDSVDEYRNKLTVPRCISIGLPEFATQQAIDYYVAKKSARFGDFKQLLGNTAELIQRLQNDLLSLAPLIKSAQGTQGEFSMEDILLFPVLRNLTIVKNVNWPEPVQNYLNTMSKLTNISLYDDRAI